MTVRTLSGLPRPVPDITCGETVTGSEVIDCRIVVMPADSPALGTVRTGGDGVRTVGVPDTPAALSDFLDPAEDARLADDGWLAAGVRLVRAVTALVEVHPVKAKRHLVQVRVPASTTRRNLRNLAQGMASAGRAPVLSHRSPAPVVRDIHVDLTDAVPEIADEAGRELRLGTVLGGATALARDLGSLPDGTLTVGRWRESGRDLAEGLPGLRTKVRGVNWLRRKGFRGLLSVCADPEQDAGLVEFTWDPAAAAGEITDARPAAVLVGGAVVPAVVRALAELRAPAGVVGLVPVTGSPVPPRPPVPGRPAEVLEHCGGLTTRLNVTGDDARRSQLAVRLAVADTLAHAVHRYRPGQVIAVGPWTTAAKTALGTRTGALFTADPGTARRLTLRGAKVGERWWPMPLPADLEPALGSPTTDLTAEPAGPAALTSALYLRRFAAGTPFTALDTAGPAVSAGTDGDVARGATGFAARTLVEWLRR